jgi:hypothetical protein
MQMTFEYVRCAWDILEQKIFWKLGNMQGKKNSDNSKKNFFPLAALTV